jgi:outer membrane receptor protein involved in Fe transport
LYRNAFPSLAIGGMCSTRFYRKKGKTLMFEKTWNAISCVTIALPVLLSSHQLAAQEEASSQLEEVVVSAQRREENVMEVPISVTVLSSEQIANANITNPSELALYTPSLSANTLFGAENASFAIRGFVQDVRTTASVATYFAEVVAPRGQTLYTSGDGAGPGELFDLANVQVLKGPQGTLFGRNSTGGAVLLVPNRPTNDFDGNVELTAGDYGLDRQQAVLNLPLTDNFRVRLGVDNQQRDGYQNNVTEYGANELGDVNYTALRLSSVWDINDSLENYTILSYVESETSNFSPKLFSCNSTAMLPFVASACRQQLANQEAIGENSIYDISSSVAHPYSFKRQKRVINTLTWQASEDISFKNILAYSSLFTQAEQSTFGSDFHADYDSDPIRRFEVATAIMSPDFPTTAQESWVAEFQVQGKSLDSRLNWQGGIYYEYSTPDGASGFRSPSLISCDPATIAGDLTQANCYDPNAGALGSILDLSAETEYTNKAVYGQGTYDLTDKWSLTLGTRYTWDKTEAYGRKVRYTYSFNTPLEPLETIQTPTAESEKLTGNVDIRYKPVEDVMTYFKYSKGYRQGGTNTQAEPGIDTYDPETVDTYELGAKAEFGGAVPGRVSVAVFYNDFTDMQLKSAYVSERSGAVPAIFNAGKSKIEGFEAEVMFLLRDDLTLFLSYSHLKSELLEQENHRDDVEAAGGGFAAATYTQTADIGDSLPYSPDHNVVATLNYQLPLPVQYGDVGFSTTYTYTSEQQVVATSASPFAELDSYTTLNLSLNWNSVFELPLDLSLFGTNVLDEEYFTYVQGGYNSLGVESASTGQPRMYGLRLKYRFGAAADY